VARPFILFLLFSILVCALADLSLSLINLGLSSFFIGLTTAIGTVIHILTNLFIIFYRLRLRRRTKESHPQNQLQWELLPPTSKVSSITLDLLLAVLFIAAFATTLLIQIMQYFVRGSLIISGRDVNGGGGGGGTNPLKGPKAIFYADAALQLLCATLLIALAVASFFERRRFQEVLNSIPVGDGPRGSLTFRG
jgi:hypothetical protein